MENNKTKLIATIIAILLIVSVAGISYAYFTAQIQGAEDETTITVTGGTMNIAFNGGNNITVSNIIPDDNPAATKTFTVTGKNTTDLKMPYSLTLEVDSNTFSDKSISYTLTSENTSGNGKTLINRADKKLDESSGSYNLGKGYFDNGNNIIHTYTLNIYFLNNPEENQNHDQGKTFKAHIGIKAEASYAFGEYIASLANNSLETGVYYEEANDYYYQGLDVNNYVFFNNELWRIIGVFETNTHGIANTNLVKIIREEQAPEIRWGAEFYYEWNPDTPVYTYNYHESDIYTYLNNDYYSSINPTYQSMIKKVDWFHTQQYYLNNTPSSEYFIERMMGVDMYSVNNYVGIMLPSDYGYSIPASLCERYWAIDHYGTEYYPGCAENSWLKPATLTEWMLTPNPLYSRVWTVSGTGTIKDLFSYESASYRPVLYLNEKVVHTSGDGSKANPYIIQL